MGEWAHRTPHRGEIAELWDALAEALRHDAPSCAGRGREFTPEEMNDARERARLAEVCAGCPILAPCGDYADAIPRSLQTGFWAGRWRSPRLQAVTA